MEKGDRYRLIIMLAFILLVICTVILLAGLWNNISMNPDVQAGNGLYLLVFAIFILATAIFIMHLLEERQVLFHHEHDGGAAEDIDKTSAEPRSEAYEAPFEVDIDLLARNIVPRMDPKETLNDYAERILLNITRHFEIVQGIIYLKDKKTQEFKSICTYAYTSDKPPPSFKEGDGLPGQVAKNKTMLNLSAIPEGYLEVHSGLGSSSPGNLLIIPLLLNKETVGIIELASFHSLDKPTEWTFRNLSKIISNSLVTKIKSTEKK